MKQVITNEAKTHEQIESQITELARQCVIKNIADAIYSNVPIDVANIRKQVADNIRKQVADKIKNNILIKIEYDFSDNLDVQLKTAFVDSSLNSQN